MSSYEPFVLPRSVEEFWEQIHKKESSKRRVKNYIQWLSDRGMIHIDIDVLLPRYNGDTQTNTLWFDLIIDKKPVCVQTLNYSVKQFDLFPERMIDWNYSRKDNKVRFPFTLKTKEKLIQFSIIIDDNCINY